MRRLLWIALAACGEAETIELDLLRPPLPQPTQSDAGVPAPGDAGTYQRASADIFPTTVEFGRVSVGRFAERELQLVNRNDEMVRIEVLSQPDSFFVLTPTEVEMRPNSRGLMSLRFAPTEAGTHDRELEIDACGDGCAVRVRVIGIAE